MEKKDLEIRATNPLYNFPVKTGKEIFFLSNNVYTHTYTYIYESKEESRERREKSGKRSNNRATYDVKERTTQYTSLLEWQCRT